MRRTHVRQPELLIPIILVQPIVSQPLHAQAIEWQAKCSPLNRNFEPLRNDQTPPRNDHMHECTIQIMHSIEIDVITHQLQNLHTGKQRVLEGTSHVNRLRHIETS
ncbi:hypothetical protein F5146DRAFT_1059092 [Armillaria mellea]|nr:hypothetical protein F5146DRAFT_1059092 [Armillaria mellea]